MMLHQQNQARKETLQAVQAELDHFLDHLHSAKFTGIEMDGGRRDWISTGDAIARLREIRSLAADPVMPLS
jgi:hypothetical protein